MFISIITFFAAVSLSITAAYYSIVGLIAIFAGSVTSVAIMAGSMEFAKIATVVWLHNNWKTATRFLKYTLSTSVIVLMLITSMGIYGFLSSAYLKSSVGFEQEYVQEQFLQNQIAQLDTEIIRTEKTLQQLDKSIDVLIERNRVTAGLRERKKQQEERDELKKQLSALLAEKSAVNNELLEIQKNVAIVEAEVGPVKYIAELVYGESSSKESLDKSVRLVILLLIFVFDPLAVLLLIASQVQYEKYRNTKKKKPVVLASVEDKIEEVEDFTNVIPQSDEILTPEEKSVRQRIQKKKERTGKNSQM